METRSRRRRLTRANLHWGVLYSAVYRKEVLTEARCSVRVARGLLEEPGAPVRIVVGIDGSQGSEAAVRGWPSRRHGHQRAKCD